MGILKGQIWGKGYETTAAAQVATSSALYSAVALDAISLGVPRAYELEAVLMTAALQHIHPLLKLMQPGLECVAWPFAKLPSDRNLQPLGSR